MLVLISFVTFLASIIVTGALFLTHKRILTSFVTLGCLVTIASFGRFLIGVSHTLELAYLGTIFMQLTACFCPMLLIYILADLCDLKIPKYTSSYMTFISCTVFILTLPFPGNDLFYKSIALVDEAGRSVLIKEFGVLHFLYPLMLFSYMGICIWVLAVALKTNRKAHIKTVIVSVALVIILMLLYIIDRITGNTIEFATHGYFITMILLVWRMERANMYDLSANISASIEALDKNGYIQFDQAFRCTSVNAKAKKLFPEIEEKWRLNRKIPQYDSYLYNEVILWLYNRRPNEKKTIQVGERFYELIVRPIPYLNKECVGYLLALVDRTNEIKYMNAIEGYKEDLEYEVEKQTEHIAAIRDSLVIGLASMVESRDDSTGNHIKRTYAVTRVFTEHLKKYTKELNVTEDFLDMVARAAPMHDLGKIAIDDAILKKQSQFTAEEFELMKVHPTEGARIVREILTGVEDPEFVRIAENVAHYHHEKWDGTGYPAGLRGEMIPIEARIMALPDVFDALASKRRYKDALPYDVVFPMIQGTLGSHFDPTLGTFFIQCRPELEKMYKKWYDEDMDKVHLNLSASHPHGKQLSSIKL